MVQIVKKKKGRPSKSDLARHSAASDSPSPAPERNLRRSGRRRNVRYTFDFDDYLDEDFDYYDDDDEDNERREKKLALLLKLQQSGAESPSSESRRVSHAPAASASSPDCDDGGKPLKKRKIDGVDEIDEDGADNNDIGDDYDDDVEVRAQKVEPKGLDFLPGTPFDQTSGSPLPDKKTLELILDKLQKKDIYGVYAEPVDPEELPDYHELIKNPMDFATVRKKLGNGKYLTLEQFENDVFLICANAVQYNAPDTIYHKQALSIQEQARRKFQRLSSAVYCSEKELKTEEKTTSSAFARKQIMKTVSRTVQEPVGSDFSSGATLAMAGDIQNGSSSAQAGGFERPNGIDSVIEGNPSLINNIVDKGDEPLSGKGLSSRPGRKASVPDEDRRATYNISVPLVTSSESMFTTFDGESKQLVPVGLHAEHSYAWSLARFAATLGSVAWKVASHRIEQALPEGFKYGRGWVGEYEPLPTPVLMLENGTQKETTFTTKHHDNADVRKGGKTYKTQISDKEHPVTGSTLVEMPSSGVAEARPSITSSISIPFPVKKEPVRMTSPDTKQSFISSPTTRATDPSATTQQQNLLSREFVEPVKKVSKNVELNCPPVATHKFADAAAKRQNPTSRMLASMLVETIPKNRNILQSASSQKSNVNGVVAGSLLNGQIAWNGLDNCRMPTSLSLPNHGSETPTYFPHGQEQGLSDPVQLMRMLAEKGQHQHSSVNPFPNDVRSVAPPSPSRKEDSSNAAAAAARAWMSVGAGTYKPAPENTITSKNHLKADSVCNVNRDHQAQVPRFQGEFPATGIQFQRDKKSLPLHPFVQHVRVGNEALPNQPMVFPQLVTPDLSRFQQQSSWRGPNQQSQPRQTPDLNIGYQSSGSPVKQSSGVLADSQQPDLALQL